MDFEPGQVMVRTFTGVGYIGSRKKRVFVVEMDIKTMNFRSRNF